MTKASQLVVVVLLSQPLFGCDPCFGRTSCPDTDAKAFSAAGSSATGAEVANLAGGGGNSTSLAGRRGGSVATFGGAGGSVASSVPSTPWTASIGGMSGSDAGPTEISGSGVGGPRSASVEPPDSPSGVTIGTLTDTTAELAWKDESDNEDGFEIGTCRSAGIATADRPDGGYSFPVCPEHDFQKVGSVQSDESTFELVGLQPETEFSYFIRSYNTLGSSGVVGVMFKTKASKPCHTEIQLHITKRWNHQILCLGASEPTPTEFVYAAEVTIFSNRRINLTSKVEHGAVTAIPADPFETDINLEILCKDINQGFCRIPSNAYTECECRGQVRQCERLEGPTLHIPGNLCEPQVLDLGAICDELMWWPDRQSDGP